MKYKKYILFDYVNCYPHPNGGLWDISDSFDTLEEALDHLNTGYYDVAYVVDRDTWEVVWEDIL